jgi:D-alanyl-lipoteichoic acid acyltransferase DltB (MBOAT superfamily)
LIDSWIGALAYTFQIYFDFSGYSDMAIGLSLLFGVRLPLNFASPYKATSIIEFWQRWHMSLSRFLRDYLYIPLGGNRKGPVRRYLNLMVTMLLGGLWHGAGWTFIVWGALHGGYLVINHMLRFVSPGFLSSSSVWTMWFKRCGVFLAVVVSWVFFRADSVPSAWAMLGGMSGAHGLGSLSGHKASIPWLGGCLLVVWLMPHTGQLFSRFSPTLPVPAGIAGTEPRFAGWRLTAPYAIILGGTLAACILAIGRFSPFLYFRF